MNINSWGTTERSLQIFVSSPNDVASEREDVNRVVQEVNRVLGSKIGIFLRVRMWERFRPRGDNIMKFIERQLQDCDLFVMIFSRRFGSPPADDSDFHSGTEQEYDVARKLRDASEKHRPEMFLYFKKCKDTDALSDPGQQFQKVLDFKERVKGSNFYREYDSSETFKHEFKDHLIDWLLDMAEYFTLDSESVYKRKILKHFFRLGNIPGHRPSTLIIYPSRTLGISLADGIKSKKEILSFDQTHLLPYMVLEDFQAIHKLTKCLNIAGCEEVVTATTDVYDPEDERHHNKIFLCLPRNEYAQKLLRGIPQAQFSVFGKQPDERVLHWQNQSGCLIIKSPQSLYLNLQRELKAEWYSHPGQCYCEDFAVLARFSNQTNEPHLATLSNVFLFGMRGLGTWGAAWYLDHFYNDLANKLAGDGPYRALLHVVFENNRIREVKDVTEMNQGFFDSLTEDANVRKTLNDHRKRIVNKSQTKMQNQLSISNGVLATEIVA